MPDPKFISQWLACTLTDADSSATSFVRPVRKKVRDEVRGEARQPFRRSPLWLAAKVVLQLLLSTELGDEALARLVYKLMVLKLLLHFLECSILEQQGTDTAMQMLAKVARRMLKLEALLSDIHGSDDTVRKLTDDALSQGSSLVSRAHVMLNERWNIVIDKEKKARTISRTSIPSHEEILRDTIHDVSKFLKYLDSTAVQQLATTRNCSNYSGQLTSECSSIFDETLITTELLNTTEIFAKKTQDLQTLFELYCEKALSFYGKNDAFGGSRMILTLLRILMELDSRATKKYPILLQHNPGVAFSILSDLLLPMRLEMNMAHDVERYFEMRTTHAKYPSLIGEPAITPESFSVRFAQQSESMRELKDKIVTDSDRRAADKRAEVQRELEEYNRLSQEIATLDHFRQANRWGKVVHKTRYCALCFKERQLESIKVRIYERPYREDEISQLAVVFELKAPRRIIILRNCLALFSVKVSKALQVKGSSNENNWWIDNSELRVHLKESSEQSQYKLGSSIHLTPQSYPPDYGLNFFVIYNTSNCQFYFNDQLQTSTLQPGSVHEYCILKVEKLSPYQNMQWYISATTHNPNEAYSRQNDCDSKLSIAEFREFGTLRAGHRLQLHNLLRSLEQRSLSLRAPSVAALVLQALWQAGPLLSSEEKETTPAAVGWLRSAHWELANKDFVKALLESVDRVVERHKNSWTDHCVLLIAVAVATRVASVATPIEARERALQLLEKCRKIGNAWIETLDRMLSTSEHLSSGETNKLRLNLIEAACCTLLTFHLDSDILASIFRSSAPGLI